MAEFDLKKFYTSKREYLNPRTGKLRKGFVRISFQEFSDWVAAAGSPERCHYCGTSSGQCAKLFELQDGGNRYQATRGGRRGRRLELDRRDASKAYDELDNLVWCCYWCNNAKSNFFTEDEFMPVAKAIGQALSLICEQGNPK
ncbi:hypothetical protein [Pedobacter steynii]|uniref:Uncharacterized protein n=1 Tax=Pedobacter steynii TaxID=430522 RepID=A0A1D7QFE8_9SPHI|nr:hypothetical protein [Pedobacter steynii]AOM77384.1 hypothetical protein BFS30_09530 [Pedobacter steynii]